MIENPFIKRTDGCVFKGQVFKNSDIVKYEVINEAVVNPNDAKDYKLKPLCIEVERVNRQEFIDSFKDDAGVKNILKKVQLTGDTTLLNSRKGEYLDISDAPKDKLDILERINSLSDFEKLDPELKKNMTLDEFLNFYTDEKIAEFIANKEKAKNKNINVEKVQVPNVEKVEVPNVEKVEVPKVESEVK